MWTLTPAWLEGPCLPAHARGKTVSVKLSFLRWEMRRWHATWGGGCTSESGRSTVDSEATSPTGKPCCTEDLESGPQQCQRLGERRALNHQVKDGCVLMTKGKVIKTRWNTTITESFCKIYWWTTDGALKVGPLAHQSPKMCKDVQPEAGVMRAETEDDAACDGHTRPRLSAEFWFWHWTIYISTRSHEESTASAVSTASDGLFFISLHRFLPQQTEVQSHRSRFHTDSLQSF